MRKPVGEWFDKRHISFNETGLDPNCDIQQAALFHAMGSFTPAFIRWMFTVHPSDEEDGETVHQEMEYARCKTLWLSSERFSARDLTQRADLAEVYRLRQQRRQAILPLMAAHAEYSVSYSLDLDTCAREYSESKYPLPAPMNAGDLGQPLIALHERMFRSAVLRNHLDDKCADDEESDAFSILRNLIVGPICKETEIPELTLLDDQIVWGRCPVRLEFAGGWADTPPYWLEHGGSVVNIAVDLKEQPPIQVFARKMTDERLSILSIDLGLAEELWTYEDVAAYRSLGSGFALARAVFAIVGFHPDFNGYRFATLKDQLRQFGGGIEISPVSAILKGSGLGTSSILVAMILGVLSDLTSRNWSRIDISRRTMALEQMLSSGGAWQDQVGGLFGGIKLISTRPGLKQEPEIRWLPGSFFEGPASEQMLLYYTGITRAAQDILGDIVRSNCWAPVVAVTSLLSPRIA